MGAGRGVLWVATLVIRVIISLSILGRTSLNALYHGKMIIASVEFYLYPTVGTVLIHSVKPELTE